MYNNELSLFGHFKIFVTLYTQVFSSPYPAIPNQKSRKNEARTALSLAREAVKENDEPERMPPPASVKGL